MNVTDVYAAATVTMSSALLLNIGPPLHTILELLPL